MLTETEIIDDILQREGGYVDDPADRGGATNHGITLETFRQWRNNPHLTKNDLMGLDIHEARKIYRKKYIDEPGISLIPDDRVRAQVADYGVNSGPRTAIKALQRVIGVKADGYIGPVTQAALRRFGYIRANNLLVRERCLHYARIMNHDHGQARFAEGWIRRAFEFLV